MQKVLLFFANILIKRGCPQMRKPTTEFGIECRVEMKKQNIRGIDLAKQIGISQCYLHDIIMGTRSGDKYIGKIAKILGLKKYMQS